MHVPLATTEPNLTLPPAMLATVAERYRGGAAALGRGRARRLASDQGLAGLTLDARSSTRCGGAPRGTVFLIGGPANAAHAAELIAASAGAPAVNACDLAVVEAAALLRHADLFVGPDSGPMNLAAAGETPAFAPVRRRRRCCAIRSSSTRSSRRHGWKVPGGMARIDPEQVLARIEPYLASH